MGGDHSPRASQGDTQGTELRSSHWNGGLQGPLSAGGGGEGPGRFGHIELKMPKGSSALGSDLTVIYEWRGTKPVSVREHLPIKMALEPRTKP